MIRFRPFLNTDPPHLCEVWRSQPPRRGLVTSISPLLLDKYVFSKPYFDRLGLIVAEDDERMLGFAHAGFGPEIAESQAPRNGVLSMLMTVPGSEASEIEQSLIALGEEYLRERGATTCTAMGVAKLSPYYLGLYGGSSLPGLLHSDEALHDTFSSAGYVPQGERIVWQRQIASFRPPVDRQLMQVRRKCVLDPQIDPAMDSWWEACQYVAHDLTRFVLRQRDTGMALGSAVFWEMEPLASSWGVHAGGIVDIKIEPDFRRMGYASFLLSESLKQLQGQGVTVIEVQTDADDDAAAGLLRKLSFDVVDRGSVLVKSLTDNSQPAD